MRRVLSVSIRLVNGVVVLTVPSAVSPEQGLAFLRSRASWVLKHLGESVRPTADPSDGSSASLFGNQLIVVTDPSVRVAWNDGRHLLLPPYLPEERLFLIRRFFAMEAERELPLLLERARQSFPCVLPSVTLTVRPMTSRWGSCTPASHTIRLNLYLVHYPRELVLEICAHELNHLRFSGHGPQFWSALKQAVPDCRSREYQLQRLSRTMVHW